MAKDWVIRLPQDEDSSNPILIHVQGKDGSKLDLDLLATDGDSAFQGKVRQRNLQKLRSKNYDGSDDDWSAIVQHTLISPRIDVLSDSLKSSLQVSCSISGKSPNSKLQLSFRNRIEEITQRIGTIELQETDETDNVDLFGWASQAIEERDNNSQNLTSSDERLESAQATIESLKSQLADLVKAKEEHETQLLLNFTSLLNEKKLKIRQQQTLLVGGSEQVKQGQSSAVALRERKTSKGGSKNKKRPAVESPEEDSRENQIDTTMDDDTTGQLALNTSRSTSRATTPISETASEAEDEEDENGQSSPHPAPKTSPLQNRNDRGKKAEESSIKESLRSSKAATTSLDDEETASEDDEL